MQTENDLEEVENGDQSEYFKIFDHPQYNYKQSYDEGVHANYEENYVNNGVNGGGSGNIRMYSMYKFEDMQQNRYGKIQPGLTGFINDFEANNKMEEDQENFTVNTDFQLKHLFSYEEEQKQKNFLQQEIQPQNAQQIPTNIINMHSIKQETVQTEQMPQQFHTNNFFLQQQQNHFQNQQQQMMNQNRQVTFQEPEILTENKTFSFQKNNNHRELRRKYSTQMTLVDQVSQQAEKLIENSVVSEFPEFSKGEQMLIKNIENLIYVEEEKFFNKNQIYFEKYFKSYYQRLIQHLKQHQSQGRLDGKQLLHFIFSFGLGMIEEFIALIKKFDNSYSMQLLKSEKLSYDDFLEEANNVSNQHFPVKAEETTSNINLNNLMEYSELKQGHFQQQNQNLQQQFQQQQQQQQQQFEQQQQLQKQQPGDIFKQPQRKLVVSSGGILQPIQQQNSDEQEENDFSENGQEAISSGKKRVPWNKEENQVLKERIKQFSPGYVIPRTVKLELANLLNKELDSVCRKVTKFVKQLKEQEQQQQPINLQSQPPPAQQNFFQQNFQNKQQEISVVQEGQIFQQPSQFSFSSSQIQEFYQQNSQNSSFFQTQQDGTNSLTTQIKKQPKQDGLENLLIQIIESFPQKKATKQQIQEKIHEKYQIGGSWEKSIAQLLASSKKFNKIRGFFKLRTQDKFLTKEETASYKNKLIYILQNQANQAADIETIILKYQEEFEPNLDEKSQKRIRDNFQKLLTQDQCFDKSQSKNIYQINNYSDN